MIRIEIFLNVPCTLNVLKNVFLNFYIKITGINLVNVILKVILRRCMVQKVERVTIVTYFINVN